MNSRMADSAYPWVIILSGFMIKFLGPSLGYVAGVYHVALMERYDDVQAVAWLGSIYSCMFSLTGPLASLVINSYDCRTCVLLSGLLGLLGFGASFFIHDIKLLFISYALVAGLGTGFAQGGCMVSIGYHFPKTSSKVSGIITCGSGLGVFIHPILTRYLLNQYGLQGAFLLNGGVMFNLCVFALLLKPSPFETERKRQPATTQLSCGQAMQAFYKHCRQFITVFKSLSFTMLLCSIFCYSMSISTLYLFLPDFLYENGASLQDSSLAISSSGIGSILSRFLVGFAANDTSVGSGVFYNCLPSVVATLTLFLPFFSLTTGGRIMYGFLTGLYTGGQFVVLIPIILETLDDKFLASGVGITSFSCGIGTLLGPPIAGVIYKKSGQYIVVFMFSAAMLFLTSATGFCSTLLRRSTDSCEHGREPDITSTEAPSEADPLAR
ncbi:monocarboxylate transporter 12-like isoform X4 [Haliotis rufescens]|uniref:monocarboxylate transporter 12-like isoform X4 n=2 Tax=Haliotis rufescens TaxID=6454 RepID=UPI00201F49D4|nr:monocarboxylate transporter 12-like isoform X4 [Haliotis rufescens]